MKIEMASDIRISWTSSQGVECVPCACVNALFSWRLLLCIFGKSFGMTARHVLASAGVGFTHDEMTLVWYPFKSRLYHKRRQEHTEYM